MNIKKIAFIWVIALVILGCIIAAGCTSTTMTQQQTTSEDKFVGAWTFPYEEEGVAGIGIDVVKNDGTGFLVVVSDDGNRLLKHNLFTWKNNNDDTYSIRGTLDNSIVTMKYDSSNDVYTRINDSTTAVHTRLNPATGIWFYEKKTANGGYVKKTFIVHPDGTVLLLSMNEKGALKIIEATLSYNTDESIVMKMANGKERTWKKESDGSYVLENKNGEKVRWVMNSEKLNFSSDKGASYSKKFADSYYYLSILGPWYNEKNKRLIFFNADGTFSTYQNREKVMEGTWSIPEFGKFAVHIEMGTNPEGKDVSGNDTIWTYDRVNDTFTAPNGEVCVRPSDSIGNLTIVKFN